MFYQRVLNYEGLLNLFTIYNAHEVFDEMIHLIILNMQLTSQSNHMLKTIKHTNHHKPQDLKHQ